LRNVRDKITEHMRGLGTRFREYFPVTTGDNNRKYKPSYYNAHTHTLSNEEK
jgi:hypothetical protein